VDLIELGTSANENEAQNALTAAQRLLGQHGLSEDDVRERDGDEYGAAALGEVVPRPEPFHGAVATLLAAHFRVRPIWIHADDPRTGRTGLQLEVVGKRSDLAMAEYVHDWVHRLAADLCPAGLGPKERKDFMAGVVAGQKRRLDEEALAARTNATDGTVALVKSKMREQELDDYFDRRHPAVRSMRRSRRSITSSFFHGESSGRAAAMKRPLGEAAPKLLKGK
jgi:hypothetical protein